MTTTMPSEGMHSVGQDVVHDVSRGWYFYGITRRESLSTTLAVVDAENQVDGANHVTHLRLLEFSDLAAVVRSVRLDEFSATAMRECLQSAPALESMVRSHNCVIEAIHARQAMLPAKLGVVYTREDEVISALRRRHDVLLRELSQLEGRDEWAVHVYADRAVISKRITDDDPGIRRLREQCAVARPGRAYFLEQQIREEVQSATERQLETLAQTAFDRLAGLAVDKQSSDARSVTESGEIEILRASFLVAREGVDAFTEAVRSIADSDADVRCELNGPWPPYSFAVCEQEEVH